MRKRLFFLTMMLLVACTVSAQLPKTMLSAQRKLSRKDEAGPSRYVYNADEDDDLFDDYDEYDDLNEYD